MSNDSARRERRRDLRVSPKGTVSVQADTCVIRGRIANLSRAGLSMTTPLPAPERLLGSAAEIDLRLDDREATWFELRGRILRLDARSVALAFDDPPASFLRVINEIVRASHHHQRVLSIVLVDATPARRSEMTEAFRAAGCGVIEVSTPLEAIVRLGESHFEPDLIAIADSSPAAVSDELRRFVDAEHPRAKLVTISDAANEPTGLLHWLSATNPAGDLATRIRKVLTTFHPG
jgi:hypothetical protein